MQHTIYFFLNGLVVAFYKIKILHIYFHSSLRSTIILTNSIMILYQHIIQMRGIIFIQHELIWMFNKIFYNKFTIISRKNKGKLKQFFFISKNLFDSN